MSFKNCVESDAKGFVQQAQVFVYPPKSPVTRVMETSTSEEVKELITGDDETPRVILTATQSFTERKHFVNMDKFEYSRKGSDPGRVLIFSHEFFDDVNQLPYRRGTRRDVNEIITCMQRLGYNITNDDVFCDLTAKEVQNKLEEVIKDENERLKKCNSLIIFYLTHGWNSEELHTRDMTIKTSDIWIGFQNCKALKNKPKMFIFQACKGIGHSTVADKASLDQNVTLTEPTEEEKDASRSPKKLVDISHFTANPLGKDMLLVYATLEGNESYRNPLTGTWFIQELCKNFSVYAWRDDVLGMLIRITKCVCGNYYTYELENPKDIEKQLPVFVSTLTKKFYLNRNKERDMLIKMQKQLNDVDERTKEILNILKKNQSKDSNTK